MSNLISWKSVPVGEKVSLWVNEENCYVSQISYTLAKHASSVKILVSFNAATVFNYVDSACPLKA